MTVNAIRGAAEALEDLPDQPAEAMERLQRLCIVYGLSSAVSSFLARACNRVVATSESRQTTCRTSVE